MDPKCNGEWSDFEIMTAKSVIASYNPDKNYGDETNKKHTAIVNDLQSWFPWKEKSKLTELYIKLVVEMVRETQSGNQSMTAINNFVNDNFENQMEDPPLDNNMGMFLPNQTYNMPEVMRMVEEVPQQHVVIPHQEREANTGIWSNTEHKQFLCGLKIYGRGKWKIISRDFVPTRTPAQVSSHAQKYFRRKESTAEKKRYSINDVGLYDAEPWKQHNPFSQGVHAFGGGAYNTNCYGSSNQIDTMNNYGQFYNAGQESSSQVSNWTGQQMGASSSAPQAFEGAGSQMAWASNQQEDDQLFF